METNNTSFPKSALNQAAVAARLRTASYLSKRLDLRGKTILTFAEDNDIYSECAISLTRNSSGNRQLGIHVADVAEYVCENSPLDTEARARRAAVHNGYVNTDMFPETIAHEICNLAPGVDRLALSVLMDIDSSGRLISIAFEESVIRVAERCAYGEIDQLGLANEASSVLSIREKYSPYTGIILEMYELAALFCAKRRERGGLDCTVFRRIFETDGEGNNISFRYVNEPDSRAMVRELGYFAANSIGEYMHSHGMPCIFVGQETISENAINFLGNIVGLEDNQSSADVRAAKISDLAKGSEYYDFVCTALKADLPCAQFSPEPIFNTLCACDKVVSFVRPVTRYADLLTLRTLKTCAAAYGNPKNLNLNRHKALVKEAAEEANKTAKFLFESRNEFANLSALNYLESSGENTFYGFPLLRGESGFVWTLLLCGALSVIPAEYAANFDFEIGTLAPFEVIALGTETEPTVVKPL